MSEFDCGWIDDEIETCNDCKHYPPDKKWPCEDCDMRYHDRFEPNDNVDCGMVTNFRLLGDL